MCKIPSFSYIIFIMISKFEIMLQIKLVLISLYVNSFFRKHFENENASPSEILYLSRWSG